VSFWLDGTLHQTWSRVGVQPRVDTYGQRKTAHVFGALGLWDAAFHYQFADVYNGHTFHQFLLMLVEAYKGRKIFLIVDNGPCHNLDEAGKAWLKAHPELIELYRLPAYSPEFNPIEGVWKLTRRRTTHNRFYKTIEERDAALHKTFTSFQHNPTRLLPQVARFQ
jgi:transposase